MNVPTSREVIGDYMYDYLSQHEYKTDDVQRKLSQTWDTKYGDLSNIDDPNQDAGYMVFSSYYLWFLIDQFGFHIDDIETLVIFSKHLGFNRFVNDCMSKRQEGMLNKNKLQDKHNKNMMNSSYGYDSLRSDAYNSTKFVNREGAFKNNRSAYHVDTIEISKNRFLSVQAKKSYEIKTPVQCALFTLDNAKYWYLNFIYNFMNKCLDMTKVHFVEGDTDSMYFSVAGSLDESEKQGFKYIIKDEKFYNEHVFKWLPYDFYCTDESYRPKLTTKEEQIKHEKKLLGCAIEKTGYNIVALGPKCYTTWGNGEDELYRLSLKLKGVSLSTNKHINSNSYLEIIENKNIINGTNYLLQYRRIDQKLQTQSNEKVVKNKLRELEELLIDLNLEEETPFIQA